MEINIQYRKTGELIPYVNNARKHSPQQVDQIAASIKEFGFNNPILIDGKKGVIAGHGRLMAAQKLGLEEVPTVELAHLSAAQRKAYILADNRLAENAEWDQELLALELDALQGMDFDTSLLGFDSKEIEAALSGMAGTEGLTDPDEVPEPPKEAITQPGDLWILGNHRVLCGDSTKEDDVARLMDGAKAGIVFTSPPYAQQRDYSENVKKTTGEWPSLMRGVFVAMRASNEAQIFVNLGLIHREGEFVTYWDEWINWMGSEGWRKFGWYVWDQGPGMPGDWNGRLAPSHEFIFHFNRVSAKPMKIRECTHAGVRHTGKGQRAKDGKVKKRSSENAEIQSHAIHDSVIRVNRQGAAHNAGGHVAPFPIGLPEIFLSSWEGSVYEPFCGSGSTLIAAEKTGRKCYGMEIDPLYCDVIVKRWEDFTGKKAVRG